MAFQYAPPAGQNDMAGRPEEQKYLDEWSKLLAQSFRAEIALLEQRLGTTPLFFTELDHTLGASVPVASVPWLGFPRGLLLESNNDRLAALAAAEQRGQQRIGFEDPQLTRPVTRTFRRQDEYLEWVAVKRGGSVVRYAFTAEGPEYWEHLAAIDREAVRRLYQEFTGRDVAWNELAWDTDVWVQSEGEPVRIYKQGDYDPFNSVNVEECAAHLTHPANTLGAEIDLAAKATVLRTDSQGELLSERRRLACCSDFGDPNRNSDPTIGLAANQTVRGGTSLTLADPVGLYIQAFDTSRVADAAGNALNGWWVVKRPRSTSPGRTLRAEFGPPPGSALTLADVRVVGEPLTSGGQLAELTTMTLFVRAANLGVAEPNAQSCRSRCCVVTGSAPTSSLLTQVRRNASCPPGMSNAFPELAPAPINPFTRREVGRGRRSDGE
jgi:hypothetical protein